MAQVGFGAVTVVDVECYKEELAALRCPDDAPSFIACGQCDGRFSKARKEIIKVGESEWCCCLCARSDMATGDDCDYYDYGDYDECDEDLNDDCDYEAYAHDYDQIASSQLAPGNDHINHGGSDEADDLSDDVSEEGFGIAVCANKAPVSETLCRAADLSTSRPGSLFSELGEDTMFQCLESFFWFFFESCRRRAPQSAFSHICKCWLEAVEAINDECRRNVFPPIPRMNGNRLKEVHPLLQTAASFYASKLLR